MAENVQFRDFSEARTRVQFRIDGDTFEAFPSVPVDAMQDLTTLGGRFSGIDPTDPAAVTEALTAIKEAVDILLLPDSAEVFKKRMSKGAPEPITLPQFMQVFQWLSEVYAGRPTQSSGTSSSSSRRGKSGTGSTATTKRAASTRAGSRSKTSAT